MGFAKGSKSYKVFTAYLVFIAIIQIALFAYSLNNTENLFLFTYYFVGQYLFMSVFYYYLLQKRWVVLTSVIGLLGIFIQYIYDPQSFEQYNAFGVSITQSIIVVFALAYYFQSLTGKSKFLYVNSGVLFYFLASILFFASGNLMIELDFSKQTEQYLSLINDITYFVFLILIFIEWFRNYRVRMIAANSMTN